MSKNNLQYIGLANTTSQTVLTGGKINAGPIYRQYTTKQCGAKGLVSQDGGVLIQKAGIYHVTVTAVGSGTAVGDVTVQLLQDGVALPGALSTQSVTTADTEIRTFVIDYYVLVNNNTIFGTCATPASSLTLSTTGVGATFTNVVMNVEEKGV